MFVFNVNVDFDNRLMETNTGDFSHLTFDELHAEDERYKFQGKFNRLKYPGGESISDVFARHQQWLSACVEMYSTKIHNVLVVGHGGTANCILHNLFNVPLELYPAFNLANGRYARVEVNNESTPKLHCFNGGGE